MTEQDLLNTKFMVENRLTQIIFPVMEKTDRITTILTTDDEWPEYVKLCIKLNITPPTQMQEEMCQHYVMKRHKKVIAGASIMTANINNSNRWVGSFRLGLGLRLGLANPNQAHLC